MTVARTTKEEVIIQFRRRMVAELVSYGLGETTIRITQSSGGVRPSLNHRRMMWLWPGGGSGNYGQQIGLGDRGLEYQGSLKVRTYVIDETDQSGIHREALAGDGALSLLDLQQAVIGKMAGKYLNRESTDLCILSDAIKFLGDTEPETEVPAGAEISEDGSPSHSFVRIDTTFGVDMFLNFEA